MFEKIVYVWGKTDGNKAVLSYADWFKSLTCAKQVWVCAFIVFAVFLACFFLFWPILMPIFGLFCIILIVVIFAVMLLILVISLIRLTNRPHDKGNRKPQTDSKSSADSKLQTDSNLLQEKLAFLKNLREKFIELGIVESMQVHELLNRINRELDEKQTKRNFVTQALSTSIAITSNGSPALNKLITSSTLVLVPSMTGCP